MGIFSSSKSTEKLIAQLEATVERQQREIDILREQNTRLTERLLLKHNVPLVQDKMPVDEVTRILNSANIFDEDDSPEGGIEDNRKEKLDAFAS